MVQRFGVYVDVENVVGVSQAYGSPGLSDILPSLKRRYGFRPGPILIASDPWIASPRGSSVISQLTAEDRASLHMANWKHVDLELAASATTELPRLDHLVLVSGDGYFSILLQDAKSRGIETTIICAIQALAIRLKLSADNWLDPEELLHDIAGILVPGDNKWVIPRLARYFSRAKKGIVIIDNYVAPETVRLASGVSPGVELTIIGKRFLRDSRASAVAEARVLKNAGWPIRLFKNESIHDRWFRVDDEWWHSGASLKDLGKKYSELNPARESYMAKQREDMLHQLLNASIEIPLEKPTRPCLRHKPQTWTRLEGL